MKPLFVALIFTCLRSSALGVEPLVIGSKDTAHYTSVAEKAWIMEDQKHLITVNDLLTNPYKYAGQFKKIKTEVVNLNFTTSSFWVHFIIKNGSDENRIFILEAARPITNTADLYILTGSGPALGGIKRSGDGIPFDLREIKHRKSLFSLSFKPFEQKEFYLNLESDGEVITLPLRLWTPEGRMDTDYKEQYFLGIYYGILFFVVIIYFFFFIALKEKSFLYYVIYVFSLLILQLSLDGLAFQIFWPGSVWWANHVLLASACITLVFILSYAMTFLKLKARFPKLQRTYHLFIALGIICLFFSLTNGVLYEITFPLINGTSLIATLFIIGTIVYMKRHAYKVDSFFALAFVAMITGTVIFILTNFSTIPLNMFTEQALKLGSVTEVVLLSLSMANKYGEIQKEKEKAQAETMEKLKEMNKLKDEINIELEKQVKGRTKEINMQKEELAEKNKDITDSINYARNIQRAILPATSEISSAVKDIFVLFRPKDIVSGDFYWFADKGPKVFIAACDCTGHGVPGAFVSMIGNNLLNQIIMEQNHNDTGEILSLLNKGVKSVFTREGTQEAQDGMDMVLLGLDIDREKGMILSVQVSGANNPFYLIREGIGNSELVKSGPLFPFQNNLGELKGESTPIGGDTSSDYKFTGTTLKLQQGDMIYLCSDGYKDQFGGEIGKKFMSKRFKQLLLGICSKSLNEQRALLDKTISEWIGTGEQIDDILVIGIKV